ncbi:MAG: hypothetical protein PHR71_11420 [Polaromonas sp.]|nr:hypothetical protein [Polaromonas sp.]
MILNQAQAEAIYGAMVALNNIGATIRCEFSHADVMFLVYETPTTNRVMITTRDSKDVLASEHETYADQAAFAAAYELQ